MKKIEKYNYQGRVDNESIKERFHQVVKDYNDEKNVPVIVGFSSEEGVRRNKGRLGASKGPFKVREKLASYAYDSDIYDSGTVIGDADLKESQSALGQILEPIYLNGATPIIIGGGHETFYGHYLGARTAFKGNIALLNFDAHFDLRDERPSSGTMFHQILSEDKDADYFVLGIQPQGNTKTLFETADHFGVKYYTIDQVRESSVIEEVYQKLKSYDSVIMTLCMDSVLEASAPGVSAPSPNGYTPEEIHRLVKTFATLENLRSFDISEVSPPLDIGDRTSALAASIIHKFLSVIKE